MKKKLICRHCGGNITKETDTELKKNYPYVCLNCDENFYSFEVIAVQGVKQNETNNKKNKQ